MNARFPTRLSLLCATILVAFSAAAVHTARSLDAGARDRARAQAEAVAGQIDTEVRHAGAHATGLAVAQAPCAPPGAWVRRPGSSWPRAGRTARC